MKKIMRKEWEKRESKDGSTGYFKVYYDLSSPDNPEYLGMVKWIPDRTFRKGDIKPNVKEWQAVWYEPKDGRNWQTGPELMTLPDAKKYVVEQLARVAG